MILGDNVNLHFFQFFGELMGSRGECLSPMWSEFDFSQVLYVAFPPNSLYLHLFPAIGEYLALGIKPEKLVLGLPWYGYDYPCLELNGNVCSIKRVPFRGVNCSDAAGRQIEFAEIEDLVISRASSAPQEDEDSVSFFFNYEDSVGGKHQVWYDNAYSLKQKYDFAADENLNGIAIWNSDLLDYSDIARAKQETKEMWDALHH